MISQPIGGVRIFKNHSIKMVKAGATVQEREMMYKVVVQTVLFNGSESWVVTDEMLKVLDGVPP